MTRALVVGMLMSMAVPALAEPGPGPGEPFGGDDAGCVPASSSRLACGAAATKSYDKLESAIVKCHVAEAQARYFEIFSARPDTFDEEACEAEAVARMQAKLTRVGSCSGTPVLHDLADNSAEHVAALDDENAGPYCDDTSGEEIDPGGDDGGFVPADAATLSCAGRVAKNLRVLASRVRKCQRTAAAKGLELADPAYDEEACEADALAKFVQAASRLAGGGTCPACLGAAEQQALAETTIARVGATNDHAFACPDPVLGIIEARADRPTLMTLGVQVLITGDEDYDATIAARYRADGEVSWKDALPLYRVRPEVVADHDVPEQFAGSIFDLRPGITYQIELHVTDADGAVDETIVLESTTREVPEDPASPVIVPVANEAQFSAALSAAQPGHVIELADGVYDGLFVITASGTAEDPIVIRGASRDGTILDGGGCEGCNILEAYGSYVHVERLTLRNASRAMRFQGDGAVGNVARRLHVHDVTLGIGTRTNQLDFYLCDNLLEGPLVWPHVYFDDGGLYSNVDGILVQGDGHVVCHNELIGFGDAIKNSQAGARSLDFYGNEVLSAYDNGVELDYGEGNVRAMRNRFTNNFVPTSFQPVQGGPAYLLRNVAVNVSHEQMKFHGVGGATGPSGVLAYHNTFVSPAEALIVEAGVASHYFEVGGNLFVGPSSPAGRVVNWDAPIDNGTFDGNGYFPDGVFRFEFRPDPATDYPSFAALQAGGVETSGRILTQPIFASGLVPPPSYATTMAAQDVTLDASSNAVDAGATLSNLNDTFTGAAPDLGALELGCPLPVYGIRAEGIDESNEPLGCE